MKLYDFKWFLPLVMMVLSSVLGHGQDFSGKWTGSLEYQGMSIGLVLHIDQTDNGLEASVDVPEQNGFGLKAKAKAQEDKLTVEMSEMAATYKAKLEGNTLDGTYSQFGIQIPLKMTRELPQAATDDDWVNDSLLSVFDNIQLGGIEVTAQRRLIKQEVDRIGYDIQGDADSKTNNVLTMLRKVPMVSVDATDEIRINGQTNFKIYRNGHPDPALSRNAKDLLKTMPASSVKRIEVITEPGAKYDAEGTTMILNIVMVDNSSIKGVSGTATAMTTQRADLIGSLNLTTQIDKVVTSVDYSVQHAGSSKSMRTKSSSLNHYTESGAELMGDGMFDVDDITFHMADVSASWEPDSLNLVSMQVSGYAYNYKALGNESNLMRDAGGNELYHYGSDNVMKENSYSFDGRIDYQHNTHLKGETITLSYMLSAMRDHSDQDTRYNEVYNMPVFYNGILQNGKENFNEHTFQLDWTRPIGEKHTIETGTKYIYRLNRSHNTMDYLGTEMNDDIRFKHVTQIGAGYVSYTFRSGPWSARAGLRYEHSYLKASYPGHEEDAFSAHLNDWVPSASVQYKFDWSNSLKFSYAASINRPSINYLNPAVIESPTSRSYGNIGLGSVHYHSMSLTYMRVGTKLTFNITPQFQFSNNGIGAVKWADGLVQVSTYANTLKTYSTNLSGFVQWMPFEKTSVMFNGSIGYNYYKSKELGLKNDRISGSFFANVTQFLPWKLQLSAFAGMWSGGVQDLYGYMGNVFMHGFSMQRSFLKEDRLTVMVMASNPFGGKYMGMKSHITQGDVTGWYKNERMARTLAISVSYRFGSLKSSVKKADKTIENDDLLNSGKKSGSSDGVAGGGMGM